MKVRRPSSPPLAYFIRSLVPPLFSLGNSYKPRSFPAGPSTISTTNFSRKSSRPSPPSAQPQKPLLTGRAAWRAGAYTAPFIPPFTIGALTAADAPASVLTAAGASSALTASTAASSTLTAGDQRTGGPS